MVPVLTWSDLDPGTGYGKMRFGYSARFQDMAGVGSFQLEQLKLGNSSKIDKTAITQGVGKKGEKKKK